MIDKYPPVLLAHMGFHTPVPRVKPIALAVLVKCYITEVLSSLQSYSMTHVSVFDVKNTCY